MHWDYGWGMGWAMTWWFVFWALIVAAVVWFIVRASGRSGTLEDSPETILKRRYARGEINREEYEQRLSDLRK